MAKEAARMRQKRARQVNLGVVVFTYYSTRYSTSPLFLEKGDEKNHRQYSPAGLMIDMKIFKNSKPQPEPRTSKNDNARGKGRQIKKTPLEKSKWTRASPQ